jgi:hypothetical protein
MKVGFRSVTEVCAWAGEEEPTVDSIMSKNSNKMMSFFIGAP